MLYTKASCIDAYMYYNVLCHAYATRINKDTNMYLYAAASDFFCGFLRSLGWPLYDLYILSYRAHVWVSYDVLHGCYILFTTENVMSAMLNTTNTF